ncbi:MAG TPA: carboxypeptidase regulatory-like domain-containing protein [Holophagaceae bacterium]
MRRLIPALLLPAVCLTLSAESTGRISGKVTTQDKKPIPGAKILLKRTDRNWSKELTADKHGAFLQVGLDPVLYDITVSADGFVPRVYPQQKIPLADVLQEEFVLLTPEQNRAEAIASGTAQPAPEDPAAAADSAGRDAFNKIIPLYNEQKYGEALVGAEDSYKKLNDAQANLKDEAAKTEVAQLLPKVARVYGICLALGSDRKAEAEPFLTKALAENPKDERALAGMIEVAKAKGDKAAEQKFQAELDAIHGPNPDVIYNKAVEAFNAGKTKEAKAELQKVQQLDPKYPEAYYLLAMVEFGEMNLKGTKQNLEKYLELAPNGKNAATAREMLKDPSLKRIK